MNLEEFKKRSSELQKENQLFYKKLKGKAPKDLDEHVHALHDEAFEEIDCLQCANCCKTTSPIFYERDIERAAKALRIKPGEFTSKFLVIDTDNDYVLKSAPCPFLDSENYCSIYDSRPNACREYPHTNRKKMIQVLDLTFKNTMVCPAVLKITESLKKIYR